MVVVFAGIPRPPFTIHHFILLISEASYVSHTPAAPLVDAVHT